MATITRVAGSGPLQLGQVEAFATRLITFREKVLRSEDARASNIASAIDTLLNELYTGNTTSAVSTGTFSNTANSANQYDLSHWHKRD